MGDCMIIFPKDLLDSSDIQDERKSGKERLKLLENLLRKLGNFDSKKDITIIDDEYLGNYDHIFEVKDLNETSFKFYNFGLDYGKSHGRYSKNFYLMMQRKNSRLIFLYDFYSTKTYEPELEVIEVSTQLSENRVLRLRNNHGHFDYLIVEENKKKYVLSLKSEAQESLLSNLEKMIEYVKRIETLNLEELLKLTKILEIKKSLLSASISVDDDVKASIDFRNEEVTAYEIIDPTKKINTRIKDTTTRKVERTVQGLEEKIITEETITENNQKIQSDLKRLLKQL